MRLGDIQGIQLLYGTPAFTAAVIASTTVTPTPITRKTVNLASAALDPTGS